MRLSVRALILRTPNNCSRSFLRTMVSPIPTRRNPNSPFFAPESCLSEYFSFLISFVNLLFVWMVLDVKLAIFVFLLNVFVGIRLLSCEHGSRLQIVC